MGIMRTENEMYDLIIGTARQDERILAAYMNGSRTNANVPKDIFQDYDVVYVVTQTRPFYEDETWIDIFGKRMYMQMPEKMDRMRGENCNLEECFGWLIQFTDGNRMDLHVVTAEFAREHILEDSLCKVQLDKNHILPEVPESTDADYYVKRPSIHDFWCDCNNFWWCLNNVAKGLWREEIPYVMDMLNQENRPLLVQMLSTKIGLENNFSCSVGKSGKYMKQYLPKEIWEEFLETYSDAVIDNIWKSVFTMCSLFHQTAVECAEKLGYAYNQDEEEGSMEFLRHVHKLPKDAEGIY